MSDESGKIGVLKQPTYREVRVRAREVEQPPAGALTGTLIWQRDSLLICDSAGHWIPVRTWVG